MSSKVTLLVESTISSGKISELKNLLKEISAHCKQTEPNMICYDWFINTDETTARVVEQYKDSDAVRFHGKNMAPFQEALGKCRTLSQLVVLGDADAELVAAMSSRGAEIWAPISSQDD